MIENTHIEPWNQIVDLVQSHQAEALQEYVDTLSSGDLARALTRMDDDERNAFLGMIHPEEAADIIEELVDAQGADIMEELPVHQAAAIADEMESDHRADLLAEMDEDDAEAILSKMDPEEAEDARKLMEFDEHTAGGIMNTEFVSYGQEALVSDVIQDMRENVEAYSDYGVQYAYVHSDSGVLVGVLRLRDLLLAPGRQPIRDIMIVNPIYMLADIPVEEVDAIFDRYPFWGLPVTDVQGKMLGVVSRANMEEHLSEEQDKAFLRFSGIIAGEELRSMPVKERVIGRLSWLVPNAFLSIVSASVLLYFEGTINSFGIGLVFFLPVICNMSGCSGNQAVAVSIRELGLGLIQPSDFVRVWIKELNAGVVNGFVLGTLIAVVGYGLNHMLWGLSPYLSVVVGIAFFFNIIVAVSLGGLVPLLLKKLHADPALGAPPILTTLSDMMGLLFVFTLATLAVKMHIL